MTKSVLHTNLRQTSVTGFGQGWILHLVFGFAHAALLPLSTVMKQCKCLIKLSNEITVQKASLTCIFFSLLFSIRASTFNSLTTSYQRCTQALFFLGTVISVHDTLNITSGHSPTCISSMYCTFSVADMSGHGYLWSFWVKLSASVTRPSIPLVSCKKLTTCS